jgi:hypothetical protein
VRRVGQQGQRVGDQAARDLDSQEQADEHERSAIQCRSASILRRGDRRVIASIAPPLAHVGHWTTSLLYLAPILIVIALLAVQSVRDRRRGMQPAADADWPAPPATPSNAEPQQRFSADPRPGGRVVYLQRRVPRRSPRAATISALRGGHAWRAGSRYIEPGWATWAPTPTTTSWTPNTHSASRCHSNSSMCCGRCARPETADQRPRSTDIARRSGGEDDGDRRCAAIEAG